MNTLYIFVHMFHFNRLQKIHLSLSQNSAIEEYDLNFIRNIICDYPTNDGQNCCAFLSVKMTSEVLFNESYFFTDIKASVENIINDFPSKVNAYREFDKYYAPDEAQKICKLADSDSQYNFDYDEMIKDHNSTLLTPKGKSDLMQCIEKLTLESNGIASYTCQPYVFTFVVHSDFLYLIDTHVVPRHSGGQMKGMIIKASKKNVNDVIQWLINRMEKSGAKHTFQSFNIARELER